MVAASTCQPRQLSFEGTNATDQTSTAPAARTPGPAREMVRQPFFSRVGDASPIVASLLLLLAGDVKTNPGPSCYACGQDFHQSDTPLNCQAQDCGVRSLKQTRCSGVPRSQHSLPWHCPTHGVPGPPVTTQPSHACYSCHNPFRPGTWLLACLARCCTNLAHAARRCSGPTAPPDQWRCLHHRNITETVAGVPASALTPSEHPRNQNRITCGGYSRTIAANIRPFVCNDCSTAYHRTCSGLSRNAANTVTSTGHWSCPQCLATAAPPILFHQCRQALRLLQWNA